MDKVIFIDWGLFLHRAIFGWSKSKSGVPATYTCLNMVLASLKDIGVAPDDTVIVCIDGRGNWRRDVDPSYKANRKDLKKDDGIDWPYWYNQFDSMVERLRVSSPFHYIRIDKLEADDIIAVGCKYYKERECIVVSSDSDFEQLTAHKNVKVYSPVSHKFKIIDNPYSVLTKKLKQEKTDNLLSPVLDEVDYNRRNMLVNLLKLPVEVEKKVLDILPTLCDNDYQLEHFPFKSLRARFVDIYNNHKPNSLEKSIKTKMKKEKKRKEKKNVHTNKKIF